MSIHTLAVYHWESALTGLAVLELEPNQSAEVIKPGLSGLFSFAYGAGLFQLQGYPLLKFHRKAVKLVDQLFVVFD